MAEDTEDKEEEEDRPVDDPPIDNDKEYYNLSIQRSNSIKKTL
jgi:hypothetical protein